MSRTKTIFYQVLAFVFAVFFSVQSSLSQPQQSNRVSDWLQLQAVPSYTLIATPHGNAFGFEWELSPVLYSFGMTKLVSPWYGFIVEPTARFSGSVELIASGQILTKKIGGSYFGGSAQLLGHIPLIERGEYLGLNVGAAKYFLGDSSPLFVVGGISTLFGIVHFNVKYSDAPSIWIWSLEFRIF